MIRLAQFLITALLVLPAAAEDESVIARDLLDYPAGPIRDAASGAGWKGPWKISSIRPPAAVGRKPSAPSAVVIGGTTERNNPLRRELAEPFRGSELFVRFQLRYAPPEDNSEFFVLWLDRLDGGDSATHGANVPNIGIHVADQGPKKDKVVFIVRIGPAHTAWSKVELERGRTYQVVGRLAKTENSERADFDRFDLWVDPRPEDLEHPDASIRHPQSVNVVRWVGFSTGRKTERADQIFVNNLELSRSWADVLIPADATKLTGPPAGKPPPPGELVWDKPVDFARDIYPLLKSRCFECHKGANSESGYRLDVHSEILGFSTGEPLAAPGASAESRIIELVASHAPDERMPPANEGKEPLNKMDIALLRAWIDQGLPWDDKLLPEPNAASDHWAFQTVVRPEIPAVDRASWVRTPVDSFIAAKQEATGLTAAPQASPRTLIRRLSLDLTGLPPAPDEIEAFVDDSSPDAYERLVERLLASKHYGERWGRYWLDLARWTESHGYQHDIPRPYAWRYRDYVVRSFNRDKPYDRFLAEQIAGDELRPYTDENVIATGFLAAARISGNNMDKAAQRNDVLIDIVNATGSVVLGLTLECAQCHNHKFDQLSQRDYYRLQSFFINGQLGNLSLRDPDTPNLDGMGQSMSKGAYDYYLSEAKKLVNKKKFAHTKQPHTWGFYSPATGDPAIERLPVVNRDPIAWEPESLAQIRARLLIRGDISRPGPEVSSGWPEVLGKAPASEKPLSRTDLANWLSGRRNPLVSRVWVNRLWQYHFGRGIVATPGDFGIQGAAPTHPELLDWLAVEFMENSWSSKHIHRQIVLSATYRQARAHHRANAALDPGNSLLWNWPRRRLEAEAIRDSVLVATGELNPAVGGPSIPPEREESELRRTLYLYQRRSDMPAIMAMFDAPEGIASCSRRGVSTVALQPLYMLNSDFMMRRAESLAGKVTALAGEKPGAQVETAFRRTLGRPPSPEERNRSVAMLTGTGEHRQHDALVRFCHALLNLNEFVYIP